jgi:hypothetical protein
MNKLFIPVFFLASLSFAAAQERQGGVDSGGGKAVVCRDTADKIVSIELLDLWEGRGGVFYGGPRIPLPSRKNFREQVRQISNRGAGIPYGPVSGLDRKAMELFEGAIFLQAGQKLEPSHDALPILTPPPGCKFEQAAAYNKRLQRFFFDRELWDAMDETNRAALLVHETIYDHLRLLVNEQDSFYTRQVVSFLFANEEYEMPGAGLPEKSYLCYAGRPGENMVSSFFVYREGSGVNAKIVLEPRTVNNVPVFMRTKDSLALFPYREHLTLEQFVGEEDYLGTESSHAWRTLVGKNSPATLGWMQELSLSLVAGTRRLRMEVAYYRPEEGPQYASSYPTVFCTTFRH